MPNPVAVNDLSPISGSLQTSRISYAVETAGKDYGQDYNSTTWYSDIPNNGQFYTIISDNYTANYYVSRSNAEGAYVEGGLPAVDEYSAPVFWITAGTSSLDVITIVNGLPDRRGQVPFNSGSQALNWVASSSNYFAVGPDYYDQIDADSLKLYLNANQIISYPTTASTWYDISGYNGLGTLTNGPTFNTNGWIAFDGTNDYVNFFNNLNLNIGTGNFSETVTFLINSVTSGQRITFKREGGLGYGYSMFIDGSGAIGFEILTPSTSIAAYGGYPSVGRWHQATFSLDRAGNGILYLDGVAGTPVNFSSFVGLDISNNQDFCLAAVSPAIGGGAYLNGNISTVSSYSKTLSAAEVAQNYYGGPIVTSSLYSMLDAGNLVSYPKTGTTAYTLTGSIDGTLTNGPSFTPAFGGGWVMDGVDDYLNTAVSSTTITPTNSWTVNIWCSLNSYPTYSGTPLNGVIFGYAYYGGLGIYAISSATGVVDIYGYFRSDSSSAIFGSYQLTLNTPTMFTLTHEAGVGCKFYVNGQLNTTSGTTGGSWPSYMPNPFYLVSPQNGVYGGGTETYIYYPITTYSTQVYNNKALTAAEVLQNYNATK
jgi:hypothetical protein